MHIGRPWAGEAVTEFLEGLSASTDEGWVSSLPGAVRVLAPEVRSWGTIQYPGKLERWVT